MKGFLKQSVQFSASFEAVGQRNLEKHELR